MKIKKLSYPATKYHDKIEAYLNKPPTSVMYSKSIKDEATGFSVGQLKQQVRSLKSKHRFVAAERLEELHISY